MAEYRGCPAGLSFGQSLSPILFLMAARARRVTARIFIGLLTVALVVGGLFAYSNRQEISDHFAAQNFQPTTEVSSLAASLYLTDAGRRVFFASQPTLDPSQNFNSQCAAVEHVEGSNVLGCYTNGTIHLFQVTDPRLSGIVEVTAAHELLHATFARLGTSEKHDLAVRLRELYDELVLTDSVLAARMSVYQDLTPIAFGNELHSVLGTEVRVLPDWLEQHYARWFQERSVVVDFFDAYSAVFAQLSARADELQASLTALRDDIEARRTAYDAAVQAFNAEVAEFNRRNEAYGFSNNPAEFYAVREALQQRSAELQAEVESLRADIARYEEMRVELEQLGTTNEELNQHMNSELAPPAAP